MGSLPHRQTLFFLCAVVVPSVVLVALGIRTLGQEEELARQHAVSLARQELLARLQGIKLRAAGGRVSPGDGEVAVVARVAAGQLVFPWDEPVAQTAAAARLARAADLQHRGQLSAAHAIDRGLLRLDPRVTDEYGVPYSLYAARRVAPGASAEERAQIEGIVARALDTSWLSPPAAHLALELAGKEALRDRATTRAEELEQTGLLAAELPLFAHKDSDSGWILFGKSPWLVGMTGLAGDRERLLVAARAKAVLSAVKLPDGFRWALEPSPGGESLGESLPGLRIAIAPGAPGVRGRSTELFYLAVLLLVISVTAFSAYLLNRDVRRETRLAAVRSQFVSSVSHELKTPISSIRTCAELMEMGRVDGGRATAEYLRTIIGESERLSRLVDGVLDFSRIEQDKRTYSLRSIALEEIVRSAVQALEYPLSQGGFELRLAVDSIPPVRGDRVALEQAVTNLLTNAMKYSGDHRDIDVSVKRQGVQAVVRVHDHGVGIAPEEQSRIFERFYRAPNTDGGNVPGAGLGLSLVDHVVKAHGGTVTVESEPGQGSAFCIFLPIAEEA